MRLLLKQRFFSWFDSYDIYDEYGSTVFSVQGKLSWGHCLIVYDKYGNEIGMLKEKVLSFLPVFEIYINGVLAGRIKKEFTFFKPKFTLNFNNWTVDGDFFEWDYSVYDGNRQIMTVAKKIWNFTDTYEINVFNDDNALAGLMIVLAIDAEKCSRGD